MITDLTQGEAPPEGRFDVCVIGAGAAGITLARKLSQAGKRVALCEGGVLDYTSDSQDLYIGTVTGDPYFDLDACRLRYFGGSTNHWGGMTRVFDPIDFERDYMGPEYEWPIRSADIEPYLAEACDIVEIGSDFSDTTVDDALGLKRIEIKFSAPINFAEKYLDDVTAAPLINMLLGANFVDLEGDAGRTTGAIFETYDGTRHVIAADKYVFAMGGIENSRFLMWLENRHGGRFFNAGMPIGRYWMEHPHLKLGEAIVAASVEEGEYFGLTDAEQRAQGLLNCRFELDRQGSNTTRRLVNEILCVAPGLGAKLLDLAKKDLICGVRLRSSWEQAPDAENRVRLTDQTDRFGIPSVDLKWRKTAMDKHTIAATIPTFNTWLQSRNLGRLKLDDWLTEGQPFPTDDDFGGNHHMGGTRMGTRKDLSVVDRDCRLHGSRNVYVAGSSIFTTGGHANPTLPLLQFTLRLADHLIG